MIKVLVSGGAGKMGQEVVKAITEAEGMDVVAIVDPNAAGTHIDAWPVAADLATAIDGTEPDVMVDFTHPSVVEQNLRIAVEMGVHCVVGTTGMTEEQFAGVMDAALDGTCVFFAPNFAIGAVLMMQFAQQAARYMPVAEVIELHHDRKADAPSGTAIRTAKLIAEARPFVPEVPGKETELPGMEGARGALVDGIPVHSIRSPGLVAHQEVIFGGQGQTLTIRHDSIDRTSFMPGVVLAVREVMNHEGLIVGLENFLEPAE